MTRRLNIDFAPPTLARTLRLTPQWAWSLGLVGLLLCLAAALSWQRAGQDQLALRDEIAAVEARLAARQTRPRVKAAPPVPEAQVLAVNSVISRLNLPWGALFEAFEQSTAPSIALLEINPDPKNHVVRGIAEARTGAAMLGYVERLKREPFWVDARLTKHEFVDQDATQPVRFEFEVLWQEGGP